MRHVWNKRSLQREVINDRLRRDPMELVAEEEQRYDDAVQAVVRRLALAAQSRCLVMLSGPSSSGKTTTALLIRDSLREMGMEAHTVSLDDFYRGREQAPRLPNGQFDYETPEALDLGRLESCMLGLLKEGRTLLPRFDFEAGRPAADTRELCLGPDAVVIFEGIHALNPVFERHIPQENVVKLFINTLSPIYAGDDKLLARRDIRLIRRLLRDVHFRASSLENTLEMWQQVVRGENLYLFPYVDTVDLVVDTTYAYEPGLFAHELLPLLREVPADTPYSGTVRHLIEALSSFEPLDKDALPASSMLREFVGASL